MIHCRKLLVVLLLMQSGLAALAHEHAETDGPSLPILSHFHIHDVLDLIVPHTSTEGEEDDEGTDHDDAVYLTTLLAEGPTPSADTFGLDLFPPARIDAVHTSVGAASRCSVKLPPATAGPRCPLYLTHCTLRN